MTRPANFGHEWKVERRRFTGDDAGRRSGSVGHSRPRERGGVVEDRFSASVRVLGSHAMMRRSSIGLGGGHSDSRPKVESCDLALLEDISITPPTSYASAQVAEVFAEDRALNAQPIEPGPGKVGDNLNSAMFTTLEKNQVVDSKRPDVVSVSFSENESGSEGGSFEISIINEEKAGSPEAGIKTSPTIQPIILETPANLPLLIDINMEMPVVSYIQPASPLSGHVGKGDIIVFLDRKSTADMSHMTLTRLLNSSKAQTGKRKLVVLPSKHGRTLLRKISQGEESSGKTTDIRERGPSRSRQVTPEKECNEKDCRDKAIGNQAVEARDAIFQSSPPTTLKLSANPGTTISSPHQSSVTQPVVSPDNGLTPLRRGRSEKIKVEDSGAQEPGIAKIADDQVNSAKSETMPAGDDKVDDDLAAKDDSNEPQHRTIAGPHSDGRHTSFRSSSDEELAGSMSTRYLSCQSRQKGCEVQKTEPVGGEPAVISDDEPPEHEDLGEESNVNREVGPIESKESSHDAPNEETTVRPPHIQAPPSPPSTPVPADEEQDRKRQTNGDDNNDDNGVDEQDSRDRERAERRNRAAPNIEFIHVDDSSSRACDLSTIYGGRWDPACHTAHRVEDTLGYMEQVSVFALRLLASLSFGLMVELSHLLQGYGVILSSVAGSLADPSQCLPDRTCRGMLGLGPDLTRVERDSRVRQAQLAEHEREAADGIVKRLKKQQRAVEGGLLVLILISIAVLVVVAVMVTKKVK
ncbi:hypothetical protein THAOC_33692 [Thalassiosira oceanica]|uniref:PDZ domain-containing protein n=1 Tax=Thalassiosira oceanica TaxID=159749 RepID=K0R6L5_THAOC|nr:hypothetical protein THAOC_33692 [Thalassiosira oceanica]|eukprot:EJK47579.1 hypothetical protein THAOC_33692 [Thalassiosira oceanica]